MGRAEEVGSSGADLLGEREEEEGRKTLKGLSGEADEEGLRLEMSGGGGREDVRREEMEVVAAGGSGVVGKFGGVASLESDLGGECHRLEGCVGGCGKAVVAAIGGGGAICGGGGGGGAEVGLRDEVDAELLPGGDFLETP